MLTCIGLVLKSQSSAEMNDCIGHETNTNFEMNQKDFVLKIFASVMKETEREYYSAALVMT